MPDISIDVDEHPDDRRARLAHPCDVCEQVMDPDEWEDRHWPHEDGCPGPGSGCACDLEVHASCCSTCSDH